MKEIKENIKETPIIGSAAMQLFMLYKNIYFFLRDEPLKKKYFAGIENIKHRREIVLDIEYGGLGDVLAFTSLPRLLKEQHNISFYISPRSLKTMKHPDIFRLCFEMNPFFCGVRETREGEEYFTYKGFASELSFMTFLTGRGGTDVISSIEKQFGLNGRGLPEIFYEPKSLAGYHDVILIDKNYISGKKMGWKYDDKTFEKEIEHAGGGELRVEYIDPAQQSLFDYADMIHSCRHFITVLSGGAALAAALSASSQKPFTVVLPYNAFGGAVDQFIFRKSSGRYIL